MHGDLCITPELCDRYQDLIEEFGGLGTWLGPVDSGDDPPVTSSSLRSWWSAHGCLRCFIKAYHKMYDTTDWDEECDPVGENYRISKPRAVSEIEKAIADWKNPGSRRADRFYCYTCTVPLRCGAALYQYGINKPAGIIAEGNGHTAWAYEVPEVWQNELLYNYPDDQGGEPCLWRVGEKVLLGAGRDVFCENARLFYMDNDYDAWKPLWSRDGNFEEAFLTALRALETPFGLLVYNNCNQATHAVLSAFGADLIPTGDDFWAGNYLPGDYFDFIRVEAEWFHKPPAPPRPGPPPPTTPSAKSYKAMLRTVNKRAARHATHIDAARNQLSKRRETEVCSKCAATYEGVGEVRGSASDRSRAEEIGTDVVYTVGPASALHLTLRCPALQSADFEPEEFAIPYTEDFDQLETEFEGHVCGTCIRLVVAGFRVVRTMPTNAGPLELCGDRLRLHKSDLEMEVLYERMTGQRSKVWSSSVAVSYRIPLPNGVVANRTLDLPFGSNDERNEYLAELDRLLEPKRR